MGNPMIKSSAMAVTYSPSAYELAGARLVDNGYHAIPIMPGTKRPGEYTMKQWYGSAQWQRYCDRLPTQIELEIWERWPDAGVCIAIDHRLKVIDIDTDDPELMGAVLSVLPETEVKKRGAKGFSAFYGGSPAIVSAPFSVGKERVVDLLAHGRQTVLPPTIHPNTGQPYTWITEDTLHDVSIDQLPVLPDNIAELIAGVLAPYGYEPPAEYVPGNGDSLWRELNDTALLNLDRWVPDLKLPDTRRAGSGYRAVAAWRGVANANLSFHKEGIKDWGEGKPYTPLDVVMKALGADLDNATTFLADRLNLQFLNVHDSFDVTAFIARNNRNKQRPQHDIN
jgi:hypothetical protein